MLRALIIALALAGVAHADPVPVTQTRAEPLLIESLAYDTAGRMLVSSVHAQGVFRIAPDGALRRWSARNARYPVFGIAADPPRRALWGAIGGARPGLVRFDLRSGRRTALIAAPAEAQWFGDLAVGPDGAVYVSDAKAGHVFRLAPGASAMVRIASVPRGSFQGLAVSPDGTRLVFANYRDGFWGLDLASGVLAKLEAPADAQLRGVDGVTRDGAALIAVQNGVAPPRVLRLTLDAGWTAIARVDVLARDAGMAEPTGGVVRDGEFVFVSRSQWTEFGEDLVPKTARPAPAVISRLPLTP